MPAPQGAGDATGGPRQGAGVTSITVCICTFRRPNLLARALGAVTVQDTAGEFTYSVVVADNDAAMSARDIVAGFAGSRVSVTYCVEPAQNISLARNKTLAFAHDEYVAFIDDDEFPARDWLLTMLQTCRRFGADGVLGPVRPWFDEAPPAWLLNGGFCDRPEHSTGRVLHWKDTRTGNVLFRRGILEGVEAPFRPEFGSGGEDQDFFRRMMAAGYLFVWCNEAVVHEVVPPERQRRRYLLKRALLRGQNERLLLTAPSLARSVVAIFVYTAMLPLAAVRGQHLVMQCAIRLLDHLGKLLGAIGIRPIRTPYLTTN
jgi:succinoglycan biosynthesis protein ExoM